jgi:hypothetical protein
MSSRFGPTIIWVAAVAACEGVPPAEVGGNGDGPDANAEGDSDADTDTDAGGNSDADSGADTETEYTGSDTPQTCEEAAVALTTIGCEFYAVDLDQHDAHEFDADGGTTEELRYALSVSNVHMTESASVAVQSRESGEWESFADAVVEPLELAVFELPDRHQNGSGVRAGGAWRIVSDVPIIVYQFNPIDGQTSYTSDASLVYPVQALTAKYEALTWKQIVETPGDGSYYNNQAYLAVAATEDGTEVTISPTSPPEAGGPVPNGMEPFSVSLDDGDVLEVATSQYGYSLTGTTVEANTGHPVAVWVGHECANIPEGTGACDHLEEQMPGVRFWGTRFVGARMPVRSEWETAERVLWQIYAKEDDTHVDFFAGPLVEGLPEGGVTLQAGQLHEMFVMGPIGDPGNFYIESDDPQKPIAVMQYMVGSCNNWVPNLLGDPAAAYVPPVEQYLSRYVVLAPSTWENDFLLVSRPSAATILVDDVPVPDGEFSPVEGATFETAQIEVDDGVHVVHCADDCEFGLLVAGYDTFDSYAYIGGMGMDAITIE